MDKGRLVRNALVAASQAIVTGITLFFIYKYLLQQIGAEDLGVWALVLATTSAASLANLGIATSTVKFISQYLARDNPEAVSSIIQTAALTVAIVLGLILPLAYPLLAYLLEFLVKPPEKVADAMLILPFSLASFWLNSLSSVFQASIDGFQRVDLRGYLLMASSVLYLLIVFSLVPLNGLLGLAQAQLIQSFLLLIFSWLILRRLLKPLPLIPYRWSSATFREILGYSLNFQVISLTQLLFDPITKSLMSRFGGVGMLAYYEMAYRMVLQLRALIVEGHRAIVPTIADVQEKNPDQIPVIYHESFRLIVFLVAVILPICIIGTPFVSVLWIGSYNTAFILFSYILFGSWFLNLLSNPAYFANLGTGHLRWNVIGHVVLGVLNVVLGVLLGNHLGAYGIAIGTGVAVITGSSLIMISYQHINNISWHTLLDRNSISLGLLSSLSVLLTTYAYWTYNPHIDVLPLFVISMVLFVLCTAWPLWKHPSRNKIIGLLRNKLASSDSISGTPTPPASS